MKIVNPIQTVAANVRREMNVRGWTQVDLAERSGVPQSRISELLSGKRDQKLGRLEQIANAFGITISALVMPVSEKNPSDYQKKQPISA